MKSEADQQESDVEDYLVEQVELHGGLCEKFHPPPKGRPDRIITWPGGIMDLAETKRPIGGRLFSWQVRDHKRRAKLGVYVKVLLTKQAVDDYIASRT